MWRALEGDLVMFELGLGYRNLKTWRLVATAAVTTNENYSVSGTCHGLPWPKRHWAELSHHG